LSFFVIFLSSLPLGPQKGLAFLHPGNLHGTYPFGDAVMGFNEIGRKIEQCLKALDGIANVQRMVIASQL
jgi:hypothetical protein